MRLISQPKNKHNIFPLFAITTFGLNALTLLLLIFHSSILKTVNTQLPASLVQLVDGRAITVDPQENLERQPEIIRRFVGETLTLMFTWSEKQSPLIVWQNTSSLLSEELRQKFESEYIQISGLAGATVANNIESLFIIKQVTQPEKINDGKWQIKISANRIFFRNNIQQETTPFIKRILLKAEDTQVISLPNQPTPLQSAIFRLSEARLRIYNVCDIKDKKCI
ncbi:MAG: hypothetical protein IGS39_02305 [Calothrix sp. C42_A2020_038]|nr:hypothetical protein [Calothrix sp. C42_A2020_038]